MTRFRDRRGGRAAEAGLVLEDDRDRDPRVVGGSEAMNQVVLMPLIPVSAVPVLPATVTPGICAAVPVPPVTTACIIIASAPAAVCGLIARPSICGVVRVTIEPSGATIRSTT